MKEQNNLESYSTQAMFQLEVKMQTVFLNPTIDVFLKKEGLTYINDPKFPIDQQHLITVLQDLEKQM